MAILFYGKVKIILFSSLFPHSRDGFTWKKIMTGFTNWPDSCDAESELAEQGQWGISVPIMAKIDNAFCKLLLPKEMNKCRRQGKPSFCMKAPAHLDQCNYQEGFFFPPLAFLSGFSLFVCLVLGFLWGGDERAEEWDARKERLIFQELLIEVWVSVNCPNTLLLWGKEGIKIILGSTHTLWMSLHSAYAFGPPCLIVSDRQQFSNHLEPWGSVNPHVYSDTWVGIPQNTKNRFFLLWSHIVCWEEQKVITNQAGERVILLLLFGLTRDIICLAKKE